MGQVLLPQAHPVGELHRGSGAARAVDDDPRPSRFLLTGSVEADLTQRVWPGTGRVVRIVLHGLTERELSCAGGSGLIQAVLEGDLNRIRLPRAVPDVDGYIELALHSGFPVRGIVLHTGPRPFELGDRLWALPICGLWAGITAQNEESA